MADAQTTLLLQINSNLRGIKDAQAAFLELQNEAKRNADGMAKLGGDSGDSFAKSFKEKLMGGIGLGAGLSVGATIAGGIMSAFRGATAAIEETLNAGVRLNATMETSQFGIAGVLKQFDPQRFANFSDAMRGSASIIEMLKQKALQLGLSFPELAEQYQATAGAMFKGGIRDLQQQIDLSVMLKRSMDAVGISGFQAVRDTADILNGIANRTMAGRMLHIDDKDLKAASEAGNLYGFLKEKLEGFNVAADASMQSLESLEKRFENTKAQVAADQTHELVAAHKELLTSMTALVSSNAWKEFVHFAGLMWGGVLSTVASTMDGITGRNLTPNQQMLAGGQRDFTAFKEKSGSVRTQEDLDSATSQGIEALRWMNVSRNSLMSEAKARGAGVLKDTLPALDSLIERTKAELDLLKNQGAQMIANNKLADEAAKLAANEAQWTKQADEARAAGVKKYASETAKAKARIMAETKAMNPELYAQTLGDDNTQMREELKNVSPDMFMTGGQRNDPAIVKDAQTAAEGKRAELTGKIAENEKLIEQVRDAAFKKSEAETKKREAGELRLLQVQAAVGTDAQKVAALQVEKNALDKTAFDYKAKALEIDQKIAKIGDDALARSRQARAEDEARAQQAEINAIKDDKQLTSDEKYAALYAMYLREQATIAEGIKAAQAVVNSQPAGSATRAQAQWEVKHLETERDVNIPKGLDENKELTLADQLNDKLTQMKNHFVDIGDVIGNTMGAGLQGMTAGVEGLLNGTERLHTAWRNIRVAIAEAAVHGVSEMIAQFLFMEVKQTALAAWGAIQRASIRTVETGHSAAMTGTQVATHVAGETAKTSATMFGSIARGVIRVGETIFHGIQVGIRVITHLVGEGLKTAATLAGAAMRIPIILAESIASVFQAGVGALAAMASIPYVGPFLAIGAMAAIIAAGMGIVKGIGKGFAEGGYTGDGGKYDVAGQVHKGEIVYSQQDVARHGGVAAVERMRVNGPATNSVGPVTASGGSPVQGNGNGNHYTAFFNTRQDADVWLASQSGRKSMVDFMKQEKYQIE